MNMRNSPFARSHTQAVFKLLPLLLMGVAIVFGVMNIQTIRFFFVGASGEEANITIDTTAVLGPMLAHGATLQGGENKDWQLAPIKDKVRVKS
jgi:hypothetical protein